MSKSDDIEQVKAMVGLTRAQRLLLTVLSKSDRYIPYGDTVALGLLQVGYAERLTTFEKIRITAAGRAALEPIPAKDTEG